MKRVCLIEHHQDLNASISATLLQAGFSVAAFARPAEALAHVCAEPPDLAIVELFLPEPDGIETLLALRRAIPDLPVLIVVGHPHALAFSSTALALKLGAMSSLQAPFSPAELIAAVNRLRPCYWLETALR